MSDAHTTTNRASCWSLTINNPTADDEESLNLARQRGWRVDGQKEVGKEGTEHYQLILHTGQVRFSAVKKIFPRAHIEIARNPSALAQYVTKDDTRVAGLPSTSDAYPSQKRFFELVWDMIENERAPCSEFDRHPSGRLRHPENALNCATGMLIRRGYVVENIASNPLTVRSWRLWHDAFRARISTSETTSQTDEARLVDENEVEAQNITVPDASVSSQELPQAQVQQAPPGPPPCPTHGPSCGFLHA